MQTLMHSHLDVDFAFHAKTLFTARELFTNNRFVKTDMANSDLTQLYAMHAFDSSAQKKLNKIFSQKPKINSSPP